VLYGGLTNTKYIKSDRTEMRHTPFKPSISTLEDCDHHNVSDKQLIQLKIAEHNNTVFAHNKQFERVYDTIERVTKTCHKPSTIEMVGLDNVRYSLNADLTATINNRKRRVLTTDDDRLYKEQFTVLSERIDDIVDSGINDPNKTFTFDSENFEVSNTNVVTLKTGEVAYNDSNVVTGGSVYSAIDKTISDISNKFDTQYQTITEETDEKLENLENSIDVKIDNSIAVAKTEIDNQISDLSNVDHRHYKYILNQIEDSSYISLLDCYYNTITLDRDISFEKYSFSYIGKPSGFFYYTRNIVGIDSVTIIPDFDKSSSLSILDKPIHIKNPSPYLPIQTTATNSGDGDNLAIKIPLDNGRHFITIDTNFASTADTEILVAKADNGNYTTIVKVHESATTRYYTLYDDGTITETKAPPSNVNYVSTTETIEIDSNCSVSFNFINGALTIEKDGITYNMSVSLPSVKPNMVVMPHILENGYMREFVLALRMKNCNHPITFTSFDNETITVIDRYKIFTADNLDKLSSDEYTYIRFNEVSPSVFLAEPMGGLINATSANS
jgi:hypothetical protein